jgi:ribosomal protein L7/L12
MDQKKLLERLAQLADDLEVDVDTSRVVLRFKDVASIAAEVKLRAVGVSEIILAAVREHGVPVEITEQVRAGQKINAIKLWRERYGSSLVDAKNAIEALAQ